MKGFLLIVAALLSVIVVVVVRCDPVIYGYEDESKNMVQDWDFEGDLSTSPWKVRSCIGEASDDSKTGSKSLWLHGRNHMNDGPYQYVTGLKVDTNYYASSFIKLLTNETGSNYIKVRLFGKFWMNDGTYSNFGIAYVPYLVADGQWIQVGGDIKSPTLGFEKLELWVRVEAAQVEYQIDTSSLYELEKQSDWNSYLDQKITQNRKNDVTISGILPSNLDLSKVAVEVSLVRHEFGFGAAIKAGRINGGSQTELKYQKFLYDHFNWAVFENDMKWKPIEKSQGNTNFAKVDLAIEKLLAHNMTIRGHTLLWGIESSMPDWALLLEGEDLMTALLDRVHYMTDHFKGKISEWDVLNEDLHGHYLEQHTGVLTLIEEVFKEARATDPDVGLLLNDYQITKNGEFTSAQTNLALMLLSKGISCTGIGIQGHLTVLPVDNEVLEKRIQITSLAGLPLTITELSVHSYDMAVRAAGMDQALRVYFSEPSVIAANVWGFTSRYGSFADDMELTEGDEMTPNAAGANMVNLITNEWNTTEVINPTSYSLDETISAFRGNYKLTVTDDGQVIHEQDFYVGKGQNSVSLSL